MCQHACRWIHAPSIDELSERVCSDPIEKDSTISGRNSLKSPNDQEGRNAALAQWQAGGPRLRPPVEHADEFTQSVFVKKVDESLRELRKAAMRTISDEKEK